MDDGVQREDWGVSGEALWGHFSGIKCAFYYAINKNSHLFQLEKTTSLYGERSSIDTPLALSLSRFSSSLVLLYKKMICVRNHQCCRCVKHLSQVLPTGHFAQGKINRSTNIFEPNIIFIKAGLNPISINNKLLFCLKKNAKILVYSRFTMFYDVHREYCFVFNSVFFS